MTDSDYGKQFEHLARTENQKSGWAIVVISISGLVIAVIVLAFAYGRVQQVDEERFTYFERQVQANKQKIDDGAAERERLNREVDALKEVLAKNNIPIPADAAGAVTTTTTAPRGSTATTSQEGKKQPPSTATQPPPSTTTTTTTQPPPSTTTTTTRPPPPKCTVPTLPGGQCVIP